MMTLRALVEGHFGYLVPEFGFRHQQVAEATHEHVLYAKYPLLVHFWWGKGEIDIYFEVAFEHSKDHAVFRPYISRTFALAEVARRNDVNALCGFQEIATSHPALKNSITTPEHASLYLGVAAEMMRESCRSLLEGDLTLLEEITMERRKRA